MTTFTYIDRVVINVVVFVVTAFWTAVTFGPAPFKESFSALFFRAVLLPKCTQTQAFLKLKDILDQGDTLLRFDY